MIIVEGMVHRHQTATVDLECDACPDPIPRGVLYVRVLWDPKTWVDHKRKKISLSKNRKQTGRVERFHVDCFIEEFTDDAAHQ